MKSPTWAIIVGILMLLFGGCDLMGDLQRIKAPKMLEIQEDLIVNIVKSVDQKEKEDRSRDSLSQNVETDVLMDSLNSILLEHDGDTSHLGTEDMSELLENMTDMLHVSEYSKKWMVRFGYIGIFVSIIYLLGGVFLLIKQWFSIRLVISALGLSIAFAIFQMVIMSMDDGGGIVSTFSSIGYTLSIIIDIILLVIVIASDKTYFMPETLSD